MNNQMMLEITEEDALKEISKRVDVFEAKINLNTIDDWEDFGNDLREETIKWYGLKSFDDVKKQYRRVQGIGIDTGKNLNGELRYSSNALRFMEQEFERNKNKPQLHNFYHDHNMWTVEAMMGRVMGLKYVPPATDEDKGVIKFDAVLNRKHPLTDRAEMFKTVSMTVISTDFMCATCGQPYRECTCDYDKQDIVSNKAGFIELSYVTIPAYPDAVVSKIDNFSAHLLGEIKEELKQKGLSTPFGKKFDASNFKPGLGSDEFSSKFDTPYLSLFADVIETVIEDKVNDTIKDKDKEKDTKVPDTEKQQSNSAELTAEDAEKLVSVFEILDTLSSLDEILHKIREK